MKENLIKIFGVAEKVKTPLALAGLVVIVLYLIFRQVLSLDVFSNIGASNTFALLQTVLSMLFWLAVTSILLGVSSYILSRVLKHQVEARTSNVQLLDARLDRQDSEYEEVPKKEGKIIRPKRRGKENV